MSHRAGTMKPIVSRGTATLIAVAAVTIILLVAAAFNIADNVKSSTAADAYWQGTVGEVDEVKVHLPPRSWFDLDSDKPVIIRLASGQRFIRWPSGLIDEIKADGRAGARVTTIGDIIPGNAIYLIAKKGEKMAKVSVTVVRKAPAEMKSALTPPATTPTPAPPIGATPIPPAKPISPKGGMA